MKDLYCVKPNSVSQPFLICRSVLDRSAVGALPAAAPPTKPAGLPQPSQPSDAIQKAMEATLASIELPPPVSQEASPAGPVDR